MADATRERLGKQVWATAWDEGRKMPFEEAVNHALEHERAPAP